MKVKSKTDFVKIENSNGKSQKALNGFCSLSLKPFQKGDILVYALLFILIVSLFFILVFPSLIFQNSASGFLVERDGQVVLTFDLSKQDPLQISSQFEDLVEIQSQNQQDKLFKVKIYSSNAKTGYNLLLFNGNDKTVKIIESTCSLTKDCTFFPALKTSGSIYCAPHNLKIVPLFGEQLVPPIAG